MDEDKNTSQTQDEVQAAQSTASDSTLDLSQVDPRLVVQTPADEPSDDLQTDTQTDDAQAVADEPTTEPATTTEPVQEVPAPETAPSRRENKRIAELTRKLAESRTQLEQRSQPQFPSTQPQSQIIGEGDYTIDQANALAQQYGQQQYHAGQQSGLQTANSLAFMTRLEIDAPKVETKYPALNPKSDQFDAGVTNLINQLYYQTVGLKTGPNNTFTVANPNIRYEEFADSFMEAVDSVASVRAADSQKNLAKQAAQTGVRPNNVVKTQYQGDDPSKMTLEQLRARVNHDLGIV